MSQILHIQNHMLHRQ